MKQKSIKLKSLIKEGTWAVPKTESQWVKAKNMLRQLEKYKKDLYNVMGDDVLFDGLDSAIERFNELLKYYKDNLD